MSDDSFEPEKYVALVFLGIFSATGTVGNSFVIRFYLKHLRTALDVFIAALACVDLVTCVLILPFTMAMEVVDHEIHEAGLCELYYFLVTSNVPFSVLLMVIIAFDRYLLINRPHLHVLTVKRAIATVIALVGFVCCLGLLTTFTVGLGTDIKNETKIHENQTQNIYGTDIKGSGVFQRSENSTVTFPHIHYRTLRSFFCEEKSDVLGPKFSATWKIVYASIYGVALFLVIILYSLVYKEIITWRRKRTRLLSTSHPESMRVKPEAETATTPSPPKSPLLVSLLQRPSRMVGSQWKSRQFYQNSKTAFMLFSVTAIFTVVFLPAFLMMNKVIQYNILIYYMYFSYNVANPFVYATLNETFRTYVKDVFCHRMTTHVAK